MMISVKDVRFGKYVIKNVPFEFDVKEKPMFTEEIKNKLADITDYMIKHELTTFEYENWEEVK